MLLKKLKEEAESGTIQVAVRPNSSKTRILSFDENTGYFKVSVRSRPKQGKANLDLINFLRKTLGKEVTIVSGLRKRKKTVRVV